MVLGGDDFTDRNTNPNAWDKVFGIALIALVIEATRRTSGWVMPFIILGFIAYAFAGPWLPLVTDLRREAQAARQPRTPAVSWKNAARRSARWRWSRTRTRLGTEP